MYELLRHTVDTIPVVDDHTHLGLTKVLEEMNQRHELNYLCDSFRTPAQSSAGFQWQEAQHRQAYKEIYGFTDEDLDDPDRREATIARYEAARNDVAATVNRILDLSNVEHVLCTLLYPKELEGNPRVGRLYSIDPFLFPFKSDRFSARPAADNFMRFFNFLLNQLAETYGLEKSPTVEQYLAFCDRALDDFKARGDVGYKFLLPYARTTFFEKVEEAEGPALWSAALAGDGAAYQRLQDLIAWHILRYATKQNMAVQVHTALVDPWSDAADPLNFMHFLREKETYPLKLVLLHAGYPNFERALTIASAAQLSTANNVHVEFSGRLMFGNPPAIVAKHMRTFLDYPNLWKKITYGSDALFGERYVLTGVRTGREAVYLALSGMIDDGIVDEAKAVEIAKDILRNNSIRLYGLPLEIL